MPVEEDFEDSLIDWTSPVVEQNLSRPLIPLPVFISPQSDVDGENPFDALERQVNDEVLDILNMSSSFLGSAQNSPAHTKVRRNEISTTAEILIRLDDDDPKEPDITQELVSFMSLPEVRASPSSVVKEDDIRDMNMGLVLTCSDQTVENLPNGLQTPLHSTVLWNSGKNSGFDECFSRLGCTISELSCTKKRERSRSLESLWSTVVDMNEDLMSITMPTWCDELSSSSDEEYDAPFMFSQSLPVIELQHSEQSSEKASSQILMVNTNGFRTRANTETKQTLLKNTLLNASFPKVNLKNTRELEKSLSVSEKLYTRMYPAALKKEISKHHSSSKRATVPLAASTPHNRKDVTLEKRDTLPTEYTGSCKSLIQRETTVPRAPSPDSTSGLRSSYRYNKMTSKARVTRPGKIRRNSLANSKVSSSQTSQLHKMNIRQKGNRSSFNI